MHDQTSAEAIERLARNDASKEPLFESDRAIVVRDSNGNPVAIDISNLHNDPLTIAQTVNAASVKGFIDYVNAHKLPESVVFYDPAKTSFLAVIDYHSQSDGSSPYITAAARLLHRATFTLPKTLQLKAWEANNRKSMTQVQFAEFLEANVNDVISPAGVEMLQLALTLKAKKNVEFESDQRLENGQVQLVYKEEIRGSWGTGNTAIPSDFRIGIPLFKGFVNEHGQPVHFEIVCKLRYRIENAKLVMWYDITDIERILERAAEEVRVAIETQTVLPMFEATLVDQPAQKPGVRQPEF